MDRHIAINTRVLEANYNPPVVKSHYYIQSNLMIQVETIGDAYMVVSGAPDRTKYHALHICDMALDMVQAMTGLRDPSSKGNMKIRVGKLTAHVCPLENHLPRSTHLWYGRL